MPRSWSLLALTTGLVGCVSGNPLYVNPTSAGDSDASTTGETTVEMTTAGSSTSSSTTTSSSGDSDSDSDSESEGETTDTGVVGYCGDGVTDDELGEECDDANTIDDDECTDACTLPACGDGVVQEGEECDNGLANDDNGECVAACKVNYCGDGLIGPSEPCDDGNNQDGDGCNAMCALEKCGNMVVDFGEACDDDNLNDLDGCTSLCAPTPTEPELLIEALGPPFGMPNGNSLDANCVGAPIGIYGHFEDGPNEATQIGANCSKVSIMPVGGGVFRLIQTGETSKSTPLGSGAMVPILFDAVCPEATPFIIGIGGFQTLNMTGITEFGITCANLLIKPVDGAYGLVVGDTAMLIVGAKNPGDVIGMLAHCDDFAGTFAGDLAFSATDTRVTAIQLACAKPDVGW
ncbi:MAG: DUF4215 domain-containing protein [Nannocystaceae bacterium]